MMMRWGLLSLFALFFSTSFVSAATLSYFDDKKSQIHEINGEVLSENPREIVFKTAKEELTISVNKIENIKYDHEPKEMVSVRNFDRQGRYEEALSELQRAASGIDLNDKHLAASLEFDIFRDMARLALIDPSRREAALKKYEEQSNTFSKSRHHYPSLELLGRLQLQAGDYDKAAETLGKLGSLDWPGYKEKAQVYLAITELRKGRPADAVRIFDGVISSTGAGLVVDEQKRQARLGKADALISSGKPAEAEALCREVIDSIADGDESTSAEARNRLGDALLAQGKKKEAVLDGYLWVHALYPAQLTEHAKAVFYLAKLFKDIGYPGYSEQMTELLKSSFGQTEWGRKLDTAGS